MTAPLQRQVRVALAIVFALCASATSATPRCEGKLLRQQIDERQQVTLTLLRAAGLPTTATN